MTLVDDLRRLDRIALREREAADLLGISADTLKRMRLAGEVPFVRLRGAVRYPVKGLVEFVDGLTEVPT